MVRTLIAAALLAGCAHPVPMATTADPTLCVHDRTSVPSIVAPTRKHTGVCYPGNCFLIDHIGGRMLERRDSLDGGETIPIRFDIRQTETEIEICDTQHHEGPCRKLKLPGVEDQVTVFPAISTDGFELYYVRREANQAFLDTIEITQQARRLGRVPLAIANPNNHELEVARVGSAILVRDRILTGHGDAANLLVDPHTGAKRVVDTASELDAQTALVFERSRVTIVNTRGLVTLAAYELPANQWRASGGVKGPLAAFVHGSPPTLVIVTKRAFTRMLRLPVCR